MSNSWLTIVLTLIYAWNDFDLSFQASGLDIVLPSIKKVREMPTYQWSYKKPLRSQYKGGPVPILQRIGLGETPDVITLSVFRQA